MDNITESVKISSEVNKKLTKYSKITGVTKRYVMDNAVSQYVDKFLKSIEKRGVK